MSLAIVTLDFFRAEYRTAVVDRSDIDPCRTDGFALFA
jgi:hypothetical protein